MKVTFPDGSYLNYYFYLDIKPEFLDNDKCLALRAWLDWRMLLLDKGTKTYRFDKFLADKVKSDDPLFFRMFIEENFVMVKFEGDLVPEIPEKYKTF